MKQKRNKSKREENYLSIILKQIRFYLKNLSYSLSLMMEKFQKSNKIKKKKKTI